MHLVRPQQPVHVNIVRPHQRRWTVVLVAPPHQLRSPVHRLRERLRDFVLHGNGCDAFCWMPYFDIPTAANFPRRVGAAEIPVDDIGLALEEPASSLWA